MFVDFPVALAAIAVLAMLYERVTRRILVVVAALLCAVVIWPGVVRESNLDARPINALPALGVLLALVLTFGSNWPSIVPLPTRRVPPILRVLAAAVVAAAEPEVATVPWVWLGAAVVAAAVGELSSSSPQPTRASPARPVPAATEPFSRRRRLHRG